MPPRSSRVIATTARSSSHAKKRLPSLPSLLASKIYKTGQTRGADDDVIYQNRVSRSSTVLIPYSYWGTSDLYPDETNKFENGYIVLIPPQVYFGQSDMDRVLQDQGLKLGENCVVSYETRAHWDDYNPKKMGKTAWKPPQKRTHPIEGEYVARVPATTAANEGEKIVYGFNTTKIKGAGIRLYEYADSATIKRCRLQLEALYWMCDDAVKVVAQRAKNMTEEEAKEHRDNILETCQREGLLDLEKLRSIRVTNGENNTICPLCLEPLEADRFFNRLAQAEGRAVPDLTVTETNLFHIEELKYRAYNHRPYNLGWGHHHCNVVTRDQGIIPTLEWMRAVLKRNDESGRQVAAAESVIPPD